MPTLKRPRQPQAGVNWVRTASQGRRCGSGRSGATPKWSRRRWPIPRPSCRCQHRGRGGGGAGTDARGRTSRCGCGTAASRCCVSCMSPQSRSPATRRSRTCGCGRCARRSRESSGPSRGRSISPPYAACGRGRGNKAATASRPCGKGPAFWVPPSLPKGRPPLSRARYGRGPHSFPSADPGAGVGTSPGVPSHAQVPQWVEVGRDREERAERPVPAPRPAAPQDALAGRGCLGRGPESAGRPINWQFTANGARIKRKRLYPPL